MSDCKVTFAWADGTYTFALRLREWEELQEKVDCGPFLLFSRLRSEQWRARDARETIRLGLVGGGMDPAKALILVSRYVDDRPLTFNIVPALAIISASLFGVEDDQPKKRRRPAKRTPRPAETESSASQAFTEPAG